MLSIASFFSLYQGYVWNSLHIVTILTLSQISKYCLDRSLTLEGDQRRAKEKDIKGEKGVRVADFNPPSPRHCWGSQLAVPKGKHITAIDDAAAIGNKSSSIHRGLPTTLI